VTERKVQRYAIRRRDRTTVIEAHCLKWENETAYFYLGEVLVAMLPREQIDSIKLLEPTEK